MNITTWYYVGIIILALDIVWVVFYYYYATVKIYNFCQKVNQSQRGRKIQNRHRISLIITQKQEEYRYLGYLWIRKKRGEWYLKIPQEMIEDSITTKYQIVSQSWFHKFRKGEKMHIDFADKYHTEVKLSAQITVKNYIATSPQL